MINKETFTRNLAAETGRTIKECKEFTEDFIAAVQKAVIEEGGVDFYGFMKIEKVLKPASKAKNPATGEEIDVPEKFVPKTKFSSRFKDAVKG